MFIFPERGSLGEIKKERFPPKEKCRGAEFESAHLELAIIWRSAGRLERHPRIVTYVTNARAESHRAFSRAVPKMKSHLDWFVILNRLARGT